MPGRVVGLDQVEAGPAGEEDRAVRGEVEPGSAPGAVAVAGLHDPEARPLVELRRQVDHQPVAVVGRRQDVADTVGHQGSRAGGRHVHHQDVARVEVRRQVGHRRLDQQVVIASGDQQPGVVATPTREVERRPWGQGLGEGDDAHDATPEGVGAAATAGTSRAS